MMVAFIDEHRDEHGVEPLCRFLQIAPSTYWRHMQLARQPERRSSRAIRDEHLKAEIVRVHTDNYGVYGVRKVWAQLNREGLGVGRCTVERLMRDLGLAGAVRGRAWITTTRPCGDADRPVDLVDRDFAAARPNELWVCDFTYVASWAGFVYVAFVIDAYARRIVGWRAARRMTADLVLDALDQAIYDRLPDPTGKLVAHSDAGSQYLSIRYAERLADNDIDASVGSVGDAYDNALVESVIGLFKTEVVRRRGPWRNLDDVEYATLEWVDWFNRRRLFGRLGNIPPAEAEQDFYRLNPPTETTEQLRTEALR